MGYDRWTAKTDILGRVAWPTEAAGRASLITVSYPDADWVWAHDSASTSPQADDPATARIRPLTAISWKSAVSGDWSKASDWSSGTVPGAADNVTIGVAGSYTVTINSAEAAASLAISATGAKVVDNNVFTLGGALSLTAGSFTLGSTGEVLGGTITVSGGSFVAGGGTLDNVSYHGTLSLAATSSYLYLTGADTFAGANGTGPGVINLTGSGATLYAEDTTTLDNATINFGGSGTSQDIYLYAHATNSATLTLGSHLTLAQTVAGSSVAINLYSYNGSASAALINQGTITASASGGYFDIYGGSFSQHTFVNEGVINVSNGDTVYLDVNLSSLGSFTTSTGGALVLDGGYTLSNTGATLSLGAGKQLTLVGTISGGTIVDSGNGLLAQGGTLTGVTYDGTLSLAAASSSLYLAGTDTFAGANGTGAGLINLTGQNAALYADDATTLDNATINFGGSGTSQNIYLYPYATNSATLTLGSHLTLAQTAAGGNVTIDLYSYASGESTALISQGTITASASGGTFSIYGLATYDHFTNQGTILVSNGDLFDLSSGTVLTNLASGTLTSGTFIVDAASTLQLANNVTITTDNANITLSGAGSTIESLNTTSNKQVTIDQKLTSIASAGTLSLLAGRNFTASAAFTDSGLLDLGGTNFTASTLTVASGGRVLGSGTVTGAVVDNGTVEARGGNLHLTGAVTGTGLLQIDAGATLELGASTTAHESASFSGQGGMLKLDAATSFASPIANFGAGDVINIGSLVATSATITGSTLTVALSGGTSLNYALTGAFANERVGVSADGHSLTAYRLAAAGPYSPSPVAFGNHHVGDTVSLALSLANIAAADGYSEALDATLFGATAGFTAAGAFTGLLAGHTDTTDLLVGLATGTAGAFSGTATINLSSDGTGIDGNGALAIGSETVNLTGAVYAYAAGSLGSSGLAFGNHHVGDVVSGALSLTNSGPNTGGYTEALDAAFLGASGGISTSGSLMGLGVGANNNTSLLLDLNTGTAGAITGSATLGLTSDGTGIDGLGTTALASQTVTASGGVYAYAAGSLGTTTVNLGIHHVGDTVTQALTLTNSGPLTGGFTEALDAAFAGAGTGITDTGSIAGLAAGASNSTSLLVGLNTAAAATINGSATLSLTSDGTGIDGLGLTSLASQLITVTGTVDNYAKEQLFQVKGTTGVGVSNHATINLGSVVQGGAALSVTLGVLNNAKGPSDVLGGSFTIAGSGFTNTGFSNFANLGAQQNEHKQVVTLATGTTGTFTETITVNGTGSNASGYSGALGVQTITVTGTVTATGTQPTAASTTGLTGLTFALDAPPPLAAAPTVADWMPGFSPAAAAAGSTSFGLFEEPKLSPFGLLTMTNHFGESLMPGFGHW